MQFLFKNTLEFSGLEYSYSNILEIWAGIRRILERICGSFPSNLWPGPSRRSSSAVPGSHHLRILLGARRSEKLNVQKRSIRHSRRRLFISQNALPGQRTFWIHIGSRHAHLGNVPGRPTYLPRRQKKASEPCIDRESKGRLRRTVHGEVRDLPKAPLFILSGTVKRTSDLVSYLIIFRSQRESLEPEGE